MLAPSKGVKWSSTEPALLRIDFSHYGFRLLNKPGRVKLKMGFAHAMLAVKHLSSQESHKSLVSTSGSCVLTFAFWPITQVGAGASCLYTASLFCALVLLSLLHDSSPSIVILGLHTHAAQSRLPSLLHPLWLLSFSWKRCQSDKLMTTFAFRKRSI